MAVLHQVAVAGQPLGGEQYSRLLITLEVFSAATRRRLAGVSSAAEARFEIRMGCHLLSAPGLFPDEELPGYGVTTRSAGR